MVTLAVVKASRKKRIGTIWEMNERWQGEEREDLPLVDLESVRYLTWLSKLLSLRLGWWLRWWPTL